MSNELIVIEPSQALQILSTTTGANQLMQNVKENVMNSDGGSMKNKSTRAKIRSNAFKATKAKTDINAKHIQPLINSILLKIQPELDTISAIKSNAKLLNAGLDSIRNEANQEVDAFEAEIKRVEDEKAMLLMIDDAYKMDIEIQEQKKKDMLLTHLEAINDNHLFDAAAKESALIAKAAAEQAEKDRIQHDNDIAEKAVKDAQVAFDLKIKQAEQDKENAELRIKAQEAAAIKAARQAAENAQTAEKKARDDENARHAADKQAIIDAELKRRKDVAHNTKIKTEIKLSLIKHAGLSNDDAINATKALVKDLIDHINVAY